MKTKHTQGKWYYAVTSNGNTSNVEIHLGRNNPDNTLMVGLMNKPFNEAVANAKLMAAAPDMLEALEEILETMKRADLKTMQDVVHVIGKIGNRAVVAIKKATDQ